MISAAAGEWRKRRKPRRAMRSVANTRCSSAASASRSRGSAGRMRMSEAGWCASAGCIAGEYGLVSARFARDVARSRNPAVRMAAVRMAGVLDRTNLLQYNTRDQNRSAVATGVATMSTLRHSHRDAPHEPATSSRSILRLSAWEGLAAVAVLIAILWGAVHWAIS